MSSPHPASHIRSLFVVLMILQPVATAAAVEVYGSKSSTTVYHTHECSSGKRIATGNRVTFASEKEAAAAGRRPCKLCARLGTPAKGRSGADTEAPKKQDKSHDKPVADEPKQDEAEAVDEGAKKDAAKPLSSAAAGAGSTVRIDEVISGDTLTTATGQLVRVCGVCCPEVEQPGGAEAKRHTAGLVTKTDVRLVPDDAEATPGKNPKRLTAFVVGKGGKDVTESLIQSGLGWFDRQCKSSRRSQLIALEQTAREARRGIWKPLTGPAGTQIVAIATEGHAFHDRACIHLKKTKVCKEVSVNEAKADGYPPCSQWLPKPEPKGPEPKGPAKPDDK